MELKDKVVAITGGSKGFGRALAQEFLRAGAEVAICSHNKKDIEATADEIGAMGIYVDVTKEEDLLNFSDKVVEKLGPIDIWINNAGIFRERKNAEELDMTQTREMFEVNVMGLINGSRVALRQMKKANFGVIINIISSAALGGRPKISTYSASKWAASGFTESIREENKDSGVMILSVFPGGMKTDLFGEDKASDFDNYKEPEEVAKKVIENLKRDNPETHLIITRTPIQWTMS